MQLSIVAIVALALNFSKVSIAQSNPKADDTGRISVQKGGIDMHSNLAP
jgi:hypothetical protein